MPLSTTLTAFQKSPELEYLVHVQDKAVLRQAFGQVDFHVQFAHFSDA